MFNDFVMNTCKPGQGALCCKYLVSDLEGIQCIKLHSMRYTIDARTNMNAQGDNCDGIPYGQALVEDIQK